MSLLLGIDIGTSAVKAVVCDESGRVAGVASADYPISRPRPLWSEQDPRDWWSGAIRAIRDAAAAAGAPASDIRAVGLSGQMHGSVLLDRAALGSGGRAADPLRPAILWNDQRTAAECAEIESAAGGRRALVELVGNAALPGFTLPKLLWIRRHEPQIWARAESILLPKDYIRFRLTGEAATDLGDASGLLLLDVDRRRWSDAAISLFDIKPSLLPRLVESGAPTGAVTDWAAEQTGLKPGTVVVGGSGDNQAGAVGAGVVKEGAILATLGTSGVVYAHSRKPHKDLRDPAACGRLHTMAAATGSARAPGEWCITGCMLSAAGSLQWCRDTLFPGVPFDTLVNEAAAVPAGSAGLVFLPYLTGERCPHPDPTARAAWIGLTGRHTRAHLVRAVLEGVTFAMAQIVDLVRSIGVEVNSARVGGGGARSALWRQMLADNFGVPVARTNTDEGPAFGAAILAGVGAGVWPSVPAACGAVIAETDRLAPDPGAPARYAPTRVVFDQLYGDLKERFGALARAEG